MLILHLSSSGRELGQLELPQEKAREKLDVLRSKMNPEDVLRIVGADCEIPGIGWHLQQAAPERDLQKLNRLAETIGGMSAEEHYHLCKALKTSCRQSLDDILQTASQIQRSGPDRFEFIPGITTPHALGVWLVEHDRLDTKVPETLRPHLDYLSIGVSYCNAHDGVFLTNGYTGLRTGAREQQETENSVLCLKLATAKDEYMLWLPTSEGRLEQAKRALGIQDFAQASITTARFSTPCLADLLPLDTVTVEDANELALCLQEMEGEEGALAKYCAALEAEQPDTFTAALNIAIDSDDYELVPEDMDEYGRQVLRRAGADDEIINTADGYMDFARLGEDSLETDGVRRTEFGLVRRLSSPFPPEQELGMQMQ